MKKLAVFAIIVLIFGTVSPSLVNHAYAQNDPSILLRIAIQADKQIVNQLDKKYKNEKPNEINILYDKGHVAVKSLDQSLSNNDIEKAKQDFLLAMNSFMQISRIISQSSEKVVVVTVSDKSNRDLTSEIDRLLDRIDKELTKAQDDGINQFQIDKAHTLILEIRELLSKNQIHDAKLVYGELKELMKNIGYSIRIT